MASLYLASNFQNEIVNVDRLWEIFGPVVDKYVVCDSGSTDGTQNRLRELAGDKLLLIETDAIKINGYGYARTKLIEYCEGADWVLIIDGDERMLPEDVEKLKVLVEENRNYDIHWLPRCHYQNWEMTKVEYGSMDNVGCDWKVAISINPDWQPRLIRRTMVNGRSKVQYKRRVHELVEGVNAETRDVDKNPVIRHFGWLKTDARKTEIASLCDKLWKMDLENKAVAETYTEEIKFGSASYSNPWNTVRNEDV